MRFTKDRFSVMEKYVTGKTVLDLGCMQYSEEQSSEPGWLHRRISSVAKEVVGVDIVGNRSCEKKYNIIKGDVQDPHLNLHRRFDVVIAGELIEHVSDQRTFLLNVRKHLRDDGLLIITTPNATSLGIFLRRILKLQGGISTAREHVLIHDNQTLRRVLELHGFELSELVYWQIESYGKKKYFTPFLKIWPDMAAHIIAVAKIRKH
jgi:2-polyprenyl-3-methyl-5-hydroxy-6-metoxy-1,4-benzoquinol methylase